MPKITRRDALASMAVAGAGFVAAAASDASAQGDKPPAAGVKANFAKYTAVKYDFTGMTLAKDMLEDHYKLYSGYVDNVNKANGELTQMLADDKVTAAAFAEVRRRLNFEYNGMRLHEYYFGAIKSGGSPVDDKLKKEVSAHWGSWENWVADFKRTGLMRGIGWAILYKDPTNNSLQNYWITDQEVGHLVGFKPILTMDVWEHAYAKQYNVTGRKAYVDDFMKDVNWVEVAKRL